MAGEVYLVLTAFDVPVTRVFNSAFNLCTLELP